MAASPDVPTLSLTETEVIEVEQPPPKRLKLTGGGGAAAAGASSSDEAAGAAVDIAAFDQRLLQLLADGRAEAVAGLLLGRSGGDPASAIVVLTPAWRVQALRRLLAASAAAGRRQWLDRAAALLRDLASRATAATPELETLKTEAADLGQELMLLMTATALRDPDKGSAEDLVRCLLGFLPHLTSAHTAVSGSVVTSATASDEASATVGLTLCGLDCLRRLLLARQASSAPPSAVPAPDGGEDTAERMRELLASAVGRLDPRLVAHGLALVGLALGPRDRLMPPRVSSAELAAFMAGHFDPRVRRAAHRCHLAWLRRSPASTSATCPALLELAHASMENDDDADVRAACVDIALAGALAGDADDAVVDAADADAIDAADAGFRRIAVAMQDASPLVRVRAALALGRLAGRVSESELAATLNRQVMTDLRLRPRRPNEPQAARSHPSAGRGAPIGDMELKDVTLLDLGSSGAFVNGFEDENSAVRAAAIRSAGRLAERCPAFADQCADILVDMLADDIHAVRLAAVRALSRLSDFRLAGPQLQVCLGALKEDSDDLRRGLRDLMAGCGLADTDCLRTMLAGLLDNLARYPADRLCVWRCAAIIGRRHSGLLQLAVTDLLCLHPYLQGTEPTKEDPAYTAVMLAVLNATARLPQMRALLPAYAARHYAYLRESLPGLTPELPQPLTAELPCLSLAAAAASATEFFDATLARVRVELLAGGSGRVGRRIRPLLADLARLGRLQPALAGRAAFARDWCQLAAAVSSAEASAAVGLTYRLQLLYSGQGDSTVEQLLRLRAELARSPQRRQPPPPPLPDPLPAGLGRLSAVLLEPTPRAAVEDKRRRFPAGLPLPVTVRARLRNCQRPDCVRVRLLLPDRRHVVWAPAPAHFVDSGASVREMATQLQVTCPRWNHAAQLQVCLAMQLDDWEAELTPCVPVLVDPQPVLKC